MAEEGTGSSGTLYGMDSRLLTWSSRGLSGSWACQLCSHTDLGGKIRFGRDSIRFSGDPSSCSDWDFSWTMVGLSYQNVHVFCVLTVAFHYEIMEKDVCREDCVLSCIMLSFLPCSHAFWSSAMFLWWKMLWNPSIGSVHWYWCSSLLRLPLNFMSHTQLILHQVGSSWHLQNQFQCNSILQSSYHYVQVITLKQVSKKLKDLLECNNWLRLWVISFIFSVWNMKCSFLMRCLLGF